MLLNVTDVSKALTSERSVVVSKCLICVSLAYFFYAEDGGDTFLRNVGSYKFHTRHIPEDNILNSYGRESLKSHLIIFI
jgi:hypothetical protein